MSYTIKFIQKKGYLVAMVTGENTPENILNYLAEVQKTCEKFKYCKVLIAEDLAGPTIGIFDIFSIINQANINTPPGTLQIAYVDLNQSHDHKAMHFAETVALNRGINIKFFDEQTQAEEWLNG